MGNKPKILVVGSFVMDLIVTTSRFPNAGETVIGAGFSTAPGGKGANQAIQAARLGADVTMVGKVGQDDFGKRLIESAAESGVRVEHILTCEDAPSAVGNVQIQSNESGTENRIIVVPGANMKLVPEDVAFLENTISEYDMVIMQHEIPTEVNRAVAKFAKAAGVPVMLNPAPSAVVPEDIAACLTYISPNEHEAEDITGIAPDGEEGIVATIAALRKMGVANTIITLGGNGCAFSDGTSIVRSPCFKCEKVVDPTAAGDSFIGAFCTATAAGIPLEEALRFANCTASITVSKMGAQTSLPYIDEVLEKLAAWGFDTAPYEILK